jgi:hypothetical protein
MRSPSLLSALVAAVFIPTPITAQSLTLTNLKAPIAKASGKAPAKTTAELWAQINGLPAPAAAAPAVVYKPGDFDPAFYARANPDVAKAYGTNVKAHYDQYGRWEGRLPYDGAKPWRPDASTPPADFAYAPACQITVGDVWAPAGTKKIRIQGQLTRFGDGTPCERSYAMQVGASNTAGKNGVPGFNLGEINGRAFDQWEVLTLPSQGSRFEFIANLPAWANTGVYHVSMRSAEYNPIVRTEFDVIVGGERPKDARYYPDVLVLSAPTPYPASLGTASYDSDLLGDLAADGWTYWDLGGLNGMIGAFTTPTTKTASGQLTNNYPIITVDGQKVRALVMRDHRSDPVQGKALFSSPMISRTLGDGNLGYRRVVMSLPKALKGTDAALWGVVPGKWPPEMDTHEGFAGDPRVYQTVHMPDGSTTSFTPYLDVSGKHEWLEEFGRQTYRLWIEKQLVVERPNLLVGNGIATTISIEGPGGAGGAADLSLPYDGMQILVHRVTWWQR